jgi:CHAD domain-containing protein
VTVIESTPWLVELEQRVAGARERPDPDQVHQLRVATRRLAAWLRLGGLHVLRDDLRWLCHAAGSVRDIDVVLELEGDPAWTRWLRSERRVQHRALTAALGSERTGGLLLALASLPPVSRSAARHELGRLAGKALAAGEELEAAPDDAERFHRLRRKVRVVRYGLEWLDEKTGAFREFQEVSGLAADRALVLRLLAAYPLIDELAARRATLEAELADRRRAALEAWGSLRVRVRELR